MVIKFMMSDYLLLKITAMCRPSNDMDNSRAMSSASSLVLLVMHIVEFQIITMNQLISFQFQCTGFWEFQSSYDSEQSAENGQPRHKVKCISAAECIPLHAKLKNFFIFPKTKMFIMTPTYIISLAK